MHPGLLVVGSAVALLVSTVASDAPRQGAKTVEVNVRIDCLAGRGVSFSLLPWSVSLWAGDSIAWKLDEQSNVDSMFVVDMSQGAWPFKRKPPYRSTKARAGGGQSLDLNQRGGRYKYAVKAVCIRSSSPAVADTVLIDPDMIIIRG